MIVAYDDRATDDLDDIETHVAKDRPRAAQRLRRRLVEACEALVTYPERGRPSLRARLRELTTVPPYVIFYSVRGDAVRIRRIVHGARLR